MEWYEIHSVMKYSYYANQDLWETSRLVSYLIAQVNSKKKLKLQDILEFQWEKSDPINVSNEERDRLQKLANEYINKYAERPSC